MNTSSNFSLPPFPNGWFRVACSDELPPNKVIPLHYFGKDLVLFRTAEGKPQVFDAHCPHLGAHLGYGGIVEGNTIRCPFHGWNFNENGYCVEIPYASKALPKVSLRSWHVSEVNGLIMVYYDAQEKLPTWQIPEIVMRNSQDWTPYKQLRWKIRSHVQEIMENSFDYAHSEFLHKQSFSAFNDISLNVDREVFECCLLVKYKLPILGELGIGMDGFMQTTSYGLGYQANHTYLKGIDEYGILLLTLMTPINEEYVDFQVLISVKKILIPVLTDLVESKMSEGTAKAIEQDIPIWENKVYRRHPLLCDGDGPIRQYRSWTRQFYSDLSEEVSTLEKTTNLT